MEQNRDPRNKPTPLQSINIQKSVAFLYADDDTQQEGNLRHSHSLLLQKRIKYLGINLTKDVKDLYLGNYRILKKEIEEDTNKWKHIPYS